jgi:cell division transport system permease protein
MGARLKRFVQEALRSVTSNVSTAIAATMTVLIGMFLLGLFIALGTWVVSYTNDVKRQLIVNAYFCTQNDPACDKEATTAQINAVHNKIAVMPEVKSMEFISKDEALEIEKKRHPEIVESLTSNPLPASFKITPKRGEDVGKIAAQLDPLPAGVGKVAYGKKTADRVLKVAKVIGAIFIFGSLILIVASIILIANTIRLSIYSRRREIEVMKLVGATNWFVRGPFILEGLLTGLVGSLAAIVLLVLAKEIALPAVIEHSSLTNDEVHALSFPLVALILIGTSLLIGAVGSGITLRRFLQV